MNSKGHGALVKPPMTAYSIRLVIGMLECWAHVLQVEEVIPVQLDVYGVQSLTAPSAKSLNDQLSGQIL